MPLETAARGRIFNYIPNTYTVPSQEVQMGLIVYVWEVVQWTTGFL